MFPLTMAEREVSEQGKNRLEKMILSQLQCQLNLTEVWFDMKMTLHHHLTTHHETHCVVAFANLSKTQ